MNPYAELLQLIRSRQPQEQNAIFAGQLAGKAPPVMTLMGETLSGQVLLPVWFDQTTMTGTERCLFYLDEQRIVVFAIY